MTRAVRERILKEANGNISDHLRNHIHLTNCIHLKNHMHKQSPILSDRALMRDLLALQRSRSLRDPSASPPSWLSDRGETEPRRSLGGDRRRDTFASTATSKVAPGEVANELSGNSGSRSKVSGRQQRGKQMKTLTEQMGDFEMDSDDERGVVSSNVHLGGRQVQQGRTGDELGHCSGLNRGKRRKFRRGRRHGNSGAKTGAVALRDVNAQNEMSVASNAYQGEEGEEDYDGQNVTRAPRNGCGIPWNWSRIHHRGKTFLDMAGRSISCGLSDPRSKKAGPSGFGRDLTEIPAASENSSVSSKTEAEALPLLVDGNTGSYEWERRYSGELGIYDNLFDDSDLASEARGGGPQRKPMGRSRDRHQNLTQKYMPRTFQDLVGQNLVVQALSNAVTRRKVGLLYIFHGPHGTGKTSTARIVARALNCQSLDRLRPCGVCNSCVNHDTGKSRNIREVGPVSNFDFERIMDLLDNMIVSQVPSHYRVFIFDDCDTLSSECWSAVSKVIDRAPRRVVFILVCSSLDVLPHIIISRCQKFFFPKLKDADIIYTLQWIASKEGLEIDKDALKLIASRSDGSLRDAEMTLEQLSLLGQRISVPLVQELVGLISDEKLVDLLDLALSADTVNTVKNLRVIMETGVEPLGLMSQLATIITDILAGSYDCTRERPRRKFFRHHPLSKEDMEKLRQALKTLSEAEKQLRTSNDKLTWLTAALLQLAPDQQYLLPSSSAETSVEQSPLALNNAGHGREMASSVRPSERSNDMLIRANDKQASGKGRKGVEEIWLEVLSKIQYIGIKEFLYQEGKLVSISYGAAPTAQLMFSSHLTKSTAEKFRGHILQAFESVLGSSVTIEIRCVLKRETKSAANTPLLLPESNDRPSQIRNTKGSGMAQSEIVEIAASPRETGVGDRADSHGESSKRRLKGVSGGEAEEATGHKKPVGEINKCQSIVRSKVSLAHVIQQAEGCSQHSAWSRRKAVSIAEKLEQENLRLESRSRSLLCWKATTRVTRRKTSRLRVRARKPRSLLKLVSCGKCLSTKSPR